MSTPMTADQMVAALTAEGLRVVELPGWRTNNREGHGPFGPLNGVVNHHTGSDVSDCAGYAAGTLFHGYSTLPGPLCQAGLGNDGTIYLVGNGRCNHAGGGDPASLAAVANNATPMDGELRPRLGNLNGVDGNAHFYGLEVMYSGGHPMSAAQYDAMVRWDAAICRFHGWDGRSVIAHREWSSDKPDPGVAFMPNVRKDVDRQLAQGGVPVAPIAPVAPPPPPPPVSREPVVQGDHGGVWMSTMHLGADNSDSVRNLQRALRDYPGISTIPLAPSGVTGHYGSETAAMCSLVYRTFNDWQPGADWADGDLSTPGRRLLDKLGLRVLG